MAQFLSDEWIANLATAARLVPVPTELRLVLQQIVRDESGSEVAYVIRIDNGQITAEPGHDAEAEITITQDRATAGAVARGEMSAQTAFMAGRLRVGGDLRAMIERAQALATIADVFGAARSSTTW